MNVVDVRIWILQVLLLLGRLSTIGGEFGARIFWMRSSCLFPFLLPELGDLIFSAAFSDGVLDFPGAFPLMYAFLRHFHTFLATTICKHSQP